MSGIWILKIAVPTSSLFPSRRIKWTENQSTGARRNYRKDISKGSIPDTIVRFPSSPSVFACGQNATMVLLMWHYSSL